MTKNESKKFWKIYIILILFLFIINLVIKIKYSSEPSFYIGIFYYLIHITVVFAFFYYFRHLDIIIKSFKLNKKEIFSVLTVITFFFIFFIMFDKPISIKLFLNLNTIPQLLVTFSEELFFRIFIVGIILRNLTFERLTFIQNDIKDNLLIISSLIISSGLFALWHKDLYINHFITGLFFYSLPFITTNKKIYPSWLLHYYNNMLALI